jgi:hypothetical protein
LGDDIAGGPDEDGILFTSFIIAGGVSKLDAFAGPGGGLLDAWIDFNADGDWFDSVERLFTSLPLAPGPNVGLPYAVPEPLKLGPSFARFRLSSGGLLPTGMAPIGEVEDYEVMLFQPIPVPELEITNFTFSVSNTVSTVEWNAETNILYQLHCSTNLTTNVWVDVGASVLGPTNLQSSAVIYTSQFYRVTAPWAK